MESTPSARAGWPGKTARCAIAVLAIAGLLIALAAPASATVSGGCILNATSTSGGQVDLTTTRVWHLKSTDRVSVLGNAPSAQTTVTAKAYALGFALPVANGTGTGATVVDATNYEMRTFALLGRVFAVEGASTGPGGGCKGQVLIVIDDVNPLLTLLGGGGVIAIVLGLIGLAWGVQKATNLGRRIAGLVALAFIGVGVSLVIQQTSTPGPDAAANAGLVRSAFVDSVVAPAQLSLDPSVIVQGLLLTMLIVLLMPFPSQLFNSTLEENSDSIRAGLRRVPILGRLARGTTTAAPEEGGSSRGVLGLIVAVLFVLVSGLLYGLLDPGFGIDARSLVTFSGIVAGLVVVTWASALPRRAVHMAVAGDRGRLSVVPSTLIITAACVLISRIVGFLPGYLYGLILGYSFARAIDQVHEARGSSASAWWMLAVAFVAWFTLGAMRTPGLEDSVPAAVAAAVLTALVVAGIEGVVFGLMPLRFLPGEAVYRWRRLQWGLLYGLGVFAFLTVLLNPTSGYVSQQSSVSFLSAVALLVVFGLSSVLFWGYFRFGRQERAG